MKESILLLTNEFHCGVNKVLSSFYNFNKAFVTQNMFCNLTKISQPAYFQAHYGLEHAIEIFDDNLVSNIAQYVAKAAS